MKNLKIFFDGKPLDYMQDDTKHVAANLPVAAHVSIKDEFGSSEGVMSMFKRWQALVAEPTPASPPMCVPVPDYMRQVFRDQGFSEERIDRIVITGFEPALTVNCLEDKTVQTVQITWADGL